MCDQNWVNRNCSNLCCGKGCWVATPFCAVALCFHRQCQNLAGCLISYVVSKLFEWFLFLVVVGVIVWYFFASLLHPYDFEIVQKRLRGSWV